MPLIHLLILAQYILVCVLYVDNNMEHRGMRVNMNKTKVMISGERQKVMQKAVRWPCGVCGRGIGNNSIQCTSCWCYCHSLSLALVKSRLVLVPAHLGNCGQSPEGRKTYACCMSTLQVWLKSVLPLLKYRIFF